MTTQNENEKSTPETKPKRGRPKKYFTEEDYKQARKRYELKQGDRHEYKYHYLIAWREKRRQQEEKMKEIRKIIEDRRNLLLTAIELMKDPEKVYQELEELNKELEQ